MKKGKNTQVRKKPRLTKFIREQLARGGFGGTRKGYDRAKEKIRYRKNVEHGR